MRKNSKNQQKILWAMPFKNLRHSRLLWMMCVTLCIALGCFLLFLREPKKTQDGFAFFNKKAHFVPLKIHSFSSANIPLLEIRIEGRTVLAKLDLGCGGALELSENILNSLEHKTFIKKNSFFGIRGKTYEANIYKLPQISVGKMEIFPMWAREESPLFNEDGVVLRKENQHEEKILGRLGWHVFEPFNLLLDCYHSKVFVCDSLNTLKGQGYLIDSFVGAPLLLDRDSIDFEAITESGSLRCVLDTGSTWNLFNQNLENPDSKNPLINLDELNGRPKDFNPGNENLLVLDLEDLSHRQKFEIGGHDFGPITFTNMKSPMGLQVIVGMEFIEDHLIFIDFQNKMIYFSPTPKKFYAKGS